MPIKSSQMQSNIKSTDLGRGRGGRLPAGQKARGSTKIISAAIPEPDRQMVQKLALSLLISESEFIRRAISEYIAKVVAQGSNS